MVVVVWVEVVVDLVVVFCCVCVVGWCVGDFDCFVGEDYVDGVV